MCPTYIYGPGSSFNALKHKLVSSTSTGPLSYKTLATVLKDNYQVRRQTASAARRHLSAEISSIVPWISTKFNAWLCRSTVLPRMAFTTESLFLFPVIKLSCLGAMVLIAKVWRVETWVEIVPPFVSDAGPMLDASGGLLCWIRRIAILRQILSTTGVAIDWHNFDSRRCSWLFSLPSRCSRAINVLLFRSRSSNVSCHHGGIVYIVTPPGSICCC